MCDDPGTPGDASQLATSYAINAVISYHCNREGFNTSGPNSYTCQYDEVSDTVSWSDNLQSLLPQCIGNEHLTEIVKYVTGWIETELFLKVLFVYLR